MKNFLITITLILSIVQQSCNSKKSDVNAKNENAFNCSDLFEVIAIHPRQLVLDFNKKQGAFLKLKKLGYENYSFGTEKRIKLKDDRIKLHDSLVEKVNVYHKFTNEITNEEIVFYEIMQHIKENKHTNSGTVLCYIESNKINEMKKCKMDYPNKSLFSDNSILLIMRNN